MIERKNDASIFVNKGRIGAIDALRAVILLFILLVHTYGGFGFRISNAGHCYDGAIDSALKSFITFFLSEKSYIVFNVLFGVSFYFILKKSSYPGMKFVWRCVLLFVFGLFNKRFYTYDALCWYAFWGVFLVAFRKMKPLQLIFVALLLKLVGLLLPYLNLADYLSIAHRYSFEKPFYSIILYRHAINDYLAAVLNGSILGTLANFLIGYSIGKMGWMERLEELVSKRLILVSLLVYAVLYSVELLFGYKSMFLSLSAGFFYSVCIIYAYYHIGCLKGVLNYLESYGKLGLTNYSFQGIFGVIFIYFFGPKVLTYGFHTLVAVMLVFYFCQALFSHWWLKIHKYGPLEYLWRSLTEMKLLGNAK